jgi:serine/threonine protein phosphatase PrpC
MATDGVWDFLSNEEVNTLVAETVKHVDYTPKRIVPLTHSITQHERIAKYCQDSSTHQWRSTNHRNVCTIFVGVRGTQREGQ